MIKKTLTAMLITVLLSSVTAKDIKKVNLIDCENPGDWTGKVLLNKKIKRNGEYSFESFGKYPTSTEYKKFIPIDPAKTYTLTCYLRSLDPENPASAFMGVYMFDKNKQRININNVAVIKGTESELTAPAVKGSKEIIVKKNPKYLKFKHWAVAFNAQTNYSDLPNFDLSSRGKAMKVEGDKIILILRSPLKKSYQAGTRIRLHSPWGAPFYWVAQGWMPGEWKKFSTTMKGIADYGTPRNRFWKGTKYVKPFVWFGNYNKKPKPGAKLLIDDFTFVKK
jgi:hypothetical protein